MILYHGGLEAVAHPDVAHSRKASDMHCMSDEYLVDELMDEASAPSTM